MSRAAAGIDAERIARDLHLMLQRDRNRGARRPRPYHLRAAERAAESCGWDTTVALQKWLSVKFPVPSSQVLSPEIVESVTTKVMDAWLKASSGKLEGRQGLVRPLVGVAHAHGRCDGKPLGLWMLEKARSPRVGERKAVAEAARLMVAAPGMVTELVTVLSAQLVDPNRLVRATAAGVAARLGPGITGTGIEQALLGCLRECAGGVTLPNRLPMRPARTMDEFAVHAEDLRGNHPDAFAWVAAAIAFSSVGLPASAKAVIAELRRGLGSPLWLVRATAAVILCRSGEGPTEAQAALSQLDSHDGPQRQEALRRLQALSGSMALPQAVLQSLGTIVRTGDLCTRAAAFGTLGGIAREHRAHSPEIREGLQRVIEGPVWPLHVFAVSALEDSRAPGLGDITNLFQRFLTKADDTGRRVQTEDSAEVIAAQAGRPIGCLCLSYVWNDNSEPGIAALADRMDAIEKIIRSTELFASSAAFTELIRERASLIILFFEGAAPALDCAEHLSKMLRGRHEVRMGLHAGAGLELKQKASGEWEIQGNLMPATTRIASRAHPGDILISERAVGSMLEKRGLSERLRRYEAITVTGAVDLTIYKLEEPAPAQTGPSNTGSFVLRRERRWSDVARSMAKWGERLLYVAAILLVLGIGFTLYGPDIKARLATMMKPRIHPPAVNTLPGQGKRGQEKKVVTGPASAPMKNSPAPDPADRTPGQNPGGERVVISPVSHARPGIEARVDGKLLPRLSPIPAQRPEGSTEGGTTQGVDVTITGHGFDVVSVTGYDGAGSPMSLPQGARYGTENAVNYIVLVVEFRDTETDKTDYLKFAFMLPAVASPP